MEQTFDAREIRVGFHPDGFRIDKTASAMNRYTKWQTKLGDRWRNPKPVCFDSLPQQGWLAVDRFDWDRVNNIEDYA
jgi:hypothetical protein